jgi:uncharacterized protein YjbI with pentapeptide repeats
VPNFGSLRWGIEPHFHNLSVLLRVEKLSIFSSAWVSCRYRHFTAHGVNIMEPRLKTRLLHFLRIAGIVLIVTAALIWVGMQGYSTEWTGFGKPAGRFMQAKMLWDWMDLLLMPLVLLGGVILLNRSGRVTERQRAEERAVLEREIAKDHQQEEALQAYFNQMADLLLKEKLSKFSAEEVRNTARIRTLTVVRGLDAKRKGSVLLFLKDSELIDREAVVDLSGADLSGASVTFASLNRVNLSEANLSGANLSGMNLSKSYLGGTNLSGANLSNADLGGTDLFQANLSGANLTRAKLSGANVNGADLRGCCLNKADLREADLSGVNLNVGDLVGANLRGANLGGAKLLGADLREADLSLADLSGIEIGETELEKAKSLEGTTMPDGTKHA